MILTGIVASLALISQSTELRKQASTGTYASCSGGTPHGARACDSFRSYVVCNNGLYNAPVSCGDGKICSGGNCVNQQPVDCLSWDGGRTVPHGSCDNRNGLVQVCRYGVYYNPAPGECGTPTPPSPTARVSPRVTPTPQSVPQPRQICTPNAKTCIGTFRIRTCSADGRTESIDRCPGNQQCINNECKAPVATFRPTPAATPRPTPVVTPNPTPSPSPSPSPQQINCTPICSGATRLTTCNPERTRRIAVNCDPGTICHNGACVQIPQSTPSPSPVVIAPRVVCAAGTVECRNSTTLQTCSPNGTTWMLTTCATGKQCVENECVVREPDSSTLPNPVVGEYTCYLANNNCSMRTQETPCDSTKSEWETSDLCGLFLPLDLDASSGTGLLEDAEMRGV